MTDPPPGQTARETVSLVPIERSHVGELREMIEEFRDAGEADVYRGTDALALEDVPAFVELLHRMRSGGYPTPDIVPMESYLIAFGDRTAGELHIRAYLSASLLRVGGHVGYKVRPSLRRRGIAKRALALALSRLNEIGIAIALLTCDDANVASAKVIEANGGLRIRSLSAEMRRYDVPTSPGVRLSADSSSPDPDAENARRAVTSWNSRPVDA